MEKEEESLIKHRKILYSQSITKSTNYILKMANKDEVVTQATAWSVKAVTQAHFDASGRLIYSHIVLQIYNIIIDIFRILYNSSLDICYHTSKYFNI